LTSGIGSAVLPSSTGPTVLSYQTVGCILIGVLLLMMPFAVWGAITGTKGLEQEVRGPADAQQRILAIEQQVEHLSGGEWRRARAAGSRT
jgi:hypothetical protein